MLIKLHVNGGGGDELQLPLPLPPAHARGRADSAARGWWAGCHLPLPLGIHPGLHSATPLSRSLSRPLLPSTQVKQLTCC